MATRDCKLVITGNMAGQFTQNILHFSCVVTGTPTTLQVGKDLCALFQTTLQDKWLDCLPDSHTMSSLRGEVISTTTNPGGGPTAVVTSGTGGHTGSRTGTCLMSSVSPLIICPFNNGTKNLTGKIFIPGVSEDDAGQNTLGNTLISNIETFITALTGALSGGSITSAEYRILNKATHDLWKPVGAYVGAVIGNLRRRNRPM